MIQELEECLVTGLEHSFEFVQSDSGASFYACSFCHIPDFVWEDSCP
jgi:hypothetical protein